MRMCENNVFWCTKYTMGDGVTLIQAFRFQEKKRDRTKKKSMTD